MSVREEVLAFLGRPESGSSAAHGEAIVLLRKLAREPMIDRCGRCHYYRSRHMSQGGPTCEHMDSPWPDVLPHGAPPDWCPLRGER